MAQPYVGEIRMFGGNFAPAGWMTCSGQLLPISENETLFQLIGTTFGGDGQSTFALPDMQGRLPVHQGSGVVLGETGGVETVTLSASQIPAHAHTLAASTASGSSSSPLGSVVAQTDGTIQRYIIDPPSIDMNPSALSAVGGGQPHDNLQPYLCIQFIISLFGIFPSQT
jgi:microcystin-dependent protein